MSHISRGRGTLSHVTRKFLKTHTSLNAMSFKINHYQQGYETDQAEIAADKSKDWEYLDSPTAANLRKPYNQDDFDPETCLYAFRDGEMVAYLIAKILEKQGKQGVVNASLSFPVYRDGHRDVAATLVIRALKVLSKKGVMVVQSCIGHDWDDTKKLASEFGYVFQIDLLAVSEGNIDDIDFGKLPEPSDEITSFDHERDMEQLCQILEQDYKWSEEQINDYVAHFSEIEDPVAHLVFRKGDELLGRILACRNRDEDPKQLEIGTILVKGGQNQEIHQQLVRAALCAAAPIEFDTYLIRASGEFMQDQIDGLADAGFEFKPALSAFAKVL